MKIKNLNIGVLILIFLSIGLISCMKEAKAQKQLLNVSDSIVSAVDTIASITSPSGFYVQGAFTLTNATTVDTLKPQALYYGSTSWVTTSVKNVRLQTNDTAIVLQASSWPADFQINDPCIIGFRLVRVMPAGSYVSTRKTYVYFRFRR